MVQIRVWFYIEFEEEKIKNQNMFHKSQPTKYCPPFGLYRYISKSISHQELAILLAVQNLAFALQSMPVIESIPLCW